MGENFKLIQKQMIYFQNSISFGISSANIIHHQLLK